MDQPVRIDLLDGDMYAGDPGPVYAWLREHAPAYFDEGNGLWGISRHADISAVERDGRLWSSTGGYRPQLPSDPSMIGMDDPEHAERRRLVYKRFTPRYVAEKYSDRVRAVVTELIDEALESKTVDAVPALAAPLPGRMIGWLLGFPDERWPELVHWSETTIVAGGGLRYVTHEAAVAAGEFAAAVLELAAERRGCPRDDLTSIWAGRPGYDDEHLASEALLLLDGGAETTRTVIATAIDALIRHPDQWALLREDPALIGNAVEEFVRWTTPVLNMCRAATRDTVLAGQKISEGRQVLMMYGSANRDPAVFTDPDTFDVTRTPGGHIAFGLGTHFCLGAALARLELRIFFEEFVRRVGSASWADDRGPRILPNAFVRGVTSFPVTLEPR
ncbi:cytochrome P450 [Planomonospora venezuelensis]|uniref:Cytochrome P450 family 142 subfamily A polypeptide 1 n=1 Tax=Planomonospora venezuelensis TaxID=1999 RepID=A0A841D6J5_PLAVE|nr:cytochrome P450 [Planomonospora venezuelensis]MBB5965099.1 cytochrome P450 family 142 subfamily A polypeptide 1 [Planomonospora venezuelensis]GIN03454.1 cytochrome P450 [Planomonospora venezuelensis]